MINRSAQRPLRCVVASVCCLLAMVTVAKDQAAPSVAQSLGYGVMLYEYFQRNNFAALREFAVAEQRGKLEGHGTHPKLMRGGISLAFGMDREAERIFRELLNGSYSQAIESQAWFYLGKIAYQRGNYERSRTVLASVGADLPIHLQDEYRSLVSQLALRFEDFTHAEKALERIAEDSPYRAYSQFNLGAALQKRFIRSQYDGAPNSDWYPASIRLDSAGEMALRLDYDNAQALSPDEFRALADRAYLASGYALLQGERYGAAIDRFKRVRLQGPYTAKAMLGYGWAEVEREQFAAALTPWEHLLGQSLLSPAVQEVYLGIPYVYEKLGAKAKALSGFERAAVSYREEMARIRKATATLKTANIMELFVVEQAEGFVDWVTARDDVVINPQSTYLAELLAGHEFQSTFTDLRDLYAMQANLEDWQRRLATFEYAMESRYQVRQNVLQGEKMALLQKIGKLETKRNTLYEELSRIESEGDVIAVMPGPQQRNARRAMAARDTAEGIIASGGDVRAKGEWAAFLAGVALWDAHEVFSENLWSVRKDLQITDEVLQRAFDKKESIERLLDEQFDLQGYRNRIASARQQLNATLLENSAAIQRAQSQLVAMANQRLARHYRSIEANLAQTQLAITRLYDINASALDAASQPPSDMESNRE